ILVVHGDDRASPSYHALRPAARTLCRYIPCHACFCPAAAAVRYYPGGRFVVLPLGKPNTLTEPIISILMRAAVQSCRCMAAVPSSYGVQFNSTCISHYFGDRHGRFAAAFGAYLASSLQVG
ncbi:unnamed protein product, partial [Urochloa humidicola]